MTMASHFAVTFIFPNSQIRQVTYQNHNRNHHPSGNMMRLTKARGTSCHCLTLVTNHSPRTLEGNQDGLLEISSVHGTLSTGHCPFPGKRSQVQFTLHFVTVTGKNGKCKVRYFLTIKSYHVILSNYRENSAMACIWSQAKI